MASVFPKFFQQCVRSCESLQSTCKYIKWREYHISATARTTLPLQCASYNMAFSLRSQNKFACPSRLTSPVVTAFRSFQGDGPFSQLLLQEIKAEKERMLDVPQPTRGWTLTQKEADCKLSKTLNQDRIQVSFNVNASIPPLESDDPNEEQNIVAQPDFTVEIRKSSNECLSFECYFPDDDLNEEGNQPENIFSIRSVVLHHGNLVESTYILDTDNIDPDVYQNMLTYLQERGIDNDFGEELVDIATAVENREYIASLEKLQKFISH